MPKIIIHHPDGTQVKYGLNGKAFTIGRAENNDIGCGVTGQATSRQCGT